MNTMTPHHYPLLIHRVHSSFSLFQICCSPHQQWEIYFLSFLVYLPIRSYVTNLPSLPPSLSHLEASLTPNKWFCAFFFLAPSHSTWDPRSLTRGGTHVPASEVQTPIHWTTLEVPISVSFFRNILFTYLLIWLHQVIFVTCGI